MYGSVCEYDKATEHLEKLLAIKKQIGDRDGEATCYGQLAVAYRSVGRYPKANQYNKEALVVASETGDRAMKARSLLVQGSILDLIGSYLKAKECCEGSDCNQ